MRRHLFVTFIAALFVSLAAQPAFADPADDLASVKTAFQNVNSVHIDVKASQESGSIDMVGQNKFHWAASNGLQLIAIGQQSWMRMGGTWIKQPEAPQQAVTMMQRLRTLNLPGSDIRKHYKVTDAGMTTAAGIPARKYHIVNRSNGDTFDLLVGSNRLPVQYVSGNETWTFSQYNSVADIRPPM